MASTNKTTNYELSQFIETDRPAWLTDYNGDMRTIDSTIKAISDVASGASGSISELADRMSTAEGNISTNTNDIATLDARADALEAGQTSDDSRLDALEAEQIVQNTAIESNTRLGYNLARPYDSASTYTVGAYVLFQDTLYKCTTAISTGEAFDPSKWLAIKATDEITAGGSFSRTNINLSGIYTGISNVLIDIWNNGASTRVTATNPQFIPSNSSITIFESPIMTLLYQRYRISFDQVSIPEGALYQISAYFTFNTNDANYNKFISHTFTPLSAIIAMTGGSAQTGTIQGVNGAITSANNRIISGSITQTGSTLNEITFNNFWMIGIS